MPLKRNDFSSLKDLKVLLHFTQFLTLMHYLATSVVQQISSLLTVLAENASMCLKYPPQIAHPLQTLQLLWLQPTYWGMDHYPIQY